MNVGELWTNTYTIDVLGFSASLQQTSDGVLNYRYYWTAIHLTMVLEYELWSKTFGCDYDFGSSVQQMK